MLKSLFSKLKVIARQLVIAFLFTTFIIFIVLLGFGKKIHLATNLVNKLFVVNNNYAKREKVISIDKIKRRLNVYPSFGDEFGSLEIPNIDVKNVLYHGETLSILKYGFGHHTGTYFPGEGGTVIIAGHNSRSQFYNLPNIKIGDEIIIKTNYGIFTYKVDRTEIIEASVLGHNLKVRNDKEELMLYTCYPVTTPGYKNKRFVVYAYLVGEVYE